MEKPFLLSGSILAVVSLLIGLAFLFLARIELMPPAQNRLLLRSSSPSQSSPLQTTTSGFGASYDGIDASNWVKYRNEKYGFELRYPSDWMLEKSDIGALQIRREANTVSVSVLDFRSPSTGSFRDWVNERPSALVVFAGREVLRWYTRGVPTPTRYAPDKLPGTEHFIMPSAEKDWAVAIHMRMDDVHSCSDCVRVFDEIVHSLAFGGMK